MPLLPLLILLIIIAVFACFFVYSVRGRTHAEGLDLLDGWLYAHRGLHRKEDAPENSRKAFERAVEAGYGAELDVHLLRDGGLAVFHDASLARMTGREGFIEDLTVDDLAGYRLGGTEETIPTFREVLAIYGGRAPLIVELKPERGNWAALCEAVCRELDGYGGVYCIESFHPRAVRWLRKNRPGIIRGQLSRNFMKKRDGHTRVLCFMGTNLMGNFLTRPDFVAYRFQDRAVLGNRLCLDLWKVRGASWTIKNQKDLETALNEGLWPIFERFAPDPATGRQKRRS